MDPYIDVQLDAVSVSVDDVDDVDIDLKEWLIVGDVVIVVDGFVVSTLMLQWLILALISMLMMLFVRFWM